MNAQTKKITRLLIAPCGMDCHLCMAYFKKIGKMPQRQNIPCLGCRSKDAGKAKSCLACRIKNCSKRIKNHGLFCFECDSFPCVRLKQLDKRYRTKYEMSMIDNLEYIRKNGIRKFLKYEEKRWVRGNKVYCVHHHKYY